MGRQSVLCEYRVRPYLCRLIAGILPGTVHANVLLHGGF